MDKKDIEVESMMTLKVGGGGGGEDKGGYSYKVEEKAEEGVTCMCTGYGGK